MRLTIDHRITCRFATPQPRLVRLLRVTPSDTHDQTVADWQIAVDCDARMTDYRDGFGNRATMLYCEGPVAEIEIVVTGEVVTSHSDGMLHGSVEPLPPRLFLRATPLTAPDPAIAAFATEVAGVGADLGALHRLSVAVAAREGGGAVPDLRDAAGVLGGGASAVPDRAHVFIAATRSLGVPARYVSGYCDLTGDQNPVAHGWAEAWIAGRGWVGMDPTLGGMPDERYVRVAVALDAVGAAPVAGQRPGEGGECAGGEA